MSDYKQHKLVRNVNFAEDISLRDFEARANAGTTKVSSSPKDADESHETSALSTSGVNSRGADENKKLFVGNLSPGMSEYQLRQYFGEFGEIENVYIKMDNQTGLCRGFAFVEFKHANAIERVNIDGIHLIGDRKADVKMARARQGKIFVGGITEQMSYKDIETHFSMFGKVLSIQMPFDKKKERRKNYCFVVFESLQKANQALHFPGQMICGKAVDVKSVIKKNYFEDKPEGPGDMREDIPEGPGYMREDIPEGPGYMSGGYGALKNPYYLRTPANHNGTVAASGYYRYADHNFDAFDSAPGKQMRTARSNRYQPY